jgi:hypothetical protein
MSLNTTANLEHGGNRHPARLPRPAVRARLPSPRLLRQHRTGPDVRRRALQGRDRPAGRPERGWEDAHVPEVPGRRARGRVSAASPSPSMKAGSRCSATPSAGGSISTPRRNLACSASCATTRRSRRWRIISFGSGGPSRSTSLTGSSSTPCPRWSASSRRGRCSTSLSRSARWSASTGSRRCSHPRRPTGSPPLLTPSIAGEIASLTDVTITLRYFEHGGEVRRAIAVMQTRGSAHDPSIRQVTIDR